MEGRLEAVGQAEGSCWAAKAPGPHPLDESPLASPFPGGSRLYPCSAWLCSCSCPSLEASSVQGLQAFPRALVRARSTLLPRHHLLYPPGSRRTEATSSTEAGTKEVFSRCLLHQ